jgi:hypothetical protein
VPVAELNKPANTRCRFLRVGKGCRVYQSEHYPGSCAAWACAWLKEGADLPRPDRAHYVVDSFLDFIELEHPIFGRARIDVVQVWVDPRHPNAHRDPALRAYLADRAARFEQAALVRFDERRAITLFAPSMTSTGEWVEHEGGCVGEQHSVAEIYGKRP